MIVFLVLIIVTANLLVYLGLQKIFNAEPPLPDDNERRAAVVISARNEEPNIPIIIESLLLQDDDNFSIYIIDDYSDDNTFAIAEEFSNQLENLKVLKNDIQPGKKNALTTGINNVEEEYILLTDADCIPRKRWVSSYLKKFSAGYDLLFGVASFFVTDKLVTKISAFENIRGFILSIAAAGFKLPYSAAGRNMGFRKSSFNLIKGYKNTMEIPFGDDGLLIREAAAKSLKIGVVHETDSYVYTHPKYTFREYLNQRKRHTRTSFYYSPKIKLFLSTWHLLNLIPFFMIFLLPVSISFIIPFFVKLLADLIMISSLQWRFGYYFDKYQIIYLQLLYELTIIVNFFNALFGKIKWR